MKNEVIYNAEFKAVVEYCKQNKLFLGVGNPSGKILILGKENTTEDSKEQMAEKNLGGWTNMIESNTQLSDIKLPNWETEYPVESVLYPWKGQKFSIRRVQADGSVTGKFGTAPTWHSYQMLVDTIFGKPKKSNDDYLDFHEYCFQSELSQINARMSHLLPKEQEGCRIESIKEREKLFTHPFFSKFQIIIVACGHYQKQYNFDVENVFKVKWIGKTTEVSDGWFNVHYSIDSEYPKIVIHTRQFSNGITIDLIKAIAEECQKFLKENNLSVL